MILAQFYRGPFDGERLVLPTEEPWPRFVIPEFKDPLVIEFFYLFAGKENNLYLYLFDEDFSAVTGTDGLAS